MDELRSQGVTVAAPPCDVTVRDAVELVLSECNKTMPPIKGCIVGAMALKVGEYIFEVVYSVSDEFYPGCRV